MLQSGTSPEDTIRKFLQKITHPFVAPLISELDDIRSLSAPAAPAKSYATLNSVGRFWSTQHGIDTLVEPDGWREALALAESTLRQDPPRSLLVSGEPLVGKTSFLRLLAQRLAPDDWSVFEASGADLQADQVYIGQLEGRIRQVVDELAKGHKLIWYIPDIVQVAMSGRHSGQSATMLDQIMPAIAAGRLIVWCEATAKGTARLVQLKPSLRGLFETVTLEPLPPAATLLLVRDVIAELDSWAHIQFDPDCAKIALDTASQYLGTSGLPGSALFLLKLTAMRAEQTGEPISARRVLETLSQFSGLPVSMLDTREQLDLKSIRDFFTARVIGQDEAVEAMIARIAMLKAGLNDPNKPIGVFLFAGPTGTGKTELAKAVSEFLFGSVERMIRLDMSEFQTHEAISKILGQSSASAIEADSLISRVRKQPFSVVLLDEFEKSHSNVWDLFLQAFDEGRLTDAMGQVADLRHCLIILTSNLGATAHRSMGLGFAPQADEFSKDQVLRAISPDLSAGIPEPARQDHRVSAADPRSDARHSQEGAGGAARAARPEGSRLGHRVGILGAGIFAGERLFAGNGRAAVEARDRPISRCAAGRHHRGKAISRRRTVSLRAQRRRGHSGRIRRPGRGCGRCGSARLPARPPSLPHLRPCRGHPGAAGNAGRIPRRCKPNMTSIEQTLQSTEWEELKDTLSNEMACRPIFGHRPDRFATLARFALMDRVKSATETARCATRHAVARGYSRSPRRYSAELSGRFALQLHLIQEGIKDAFDNAPIELALTIEPVFDGAGDRQATLTWCRKLTAMYRAWAGKRRMHISDVASRSKDKETPILLISGFGAHRVLAPEAGLHVFEPFEGSGNRVTARVRLRGGAARRRARRQGAQAGERGHRRSAATEQCGAALSRGAAAGA